jgi:hypothetical protein
VPPSTYSASRGVGKIVWQEFDRDRSIQPGIGGAVHLPHAALADLGFDPVDSDSRSRPDPGDGKSLGNGLFGGVTGEQFVDFAANIRVGGGEEAFALHSSGGARAL